MRLIFDVGESMAFRLSLFIISLLGVSLASKALADAHPSFEISGGSSAFFSLQSTATTSGASDQNSAVTNLAVTGGYFLDNPHFEPFFSFTTNIVAGANSQSDFVPSIGLKYNFADDIANSFVLGARVGESFLSNVSSHQYSLFLWAAFVQKRFALNEHVAWLPEVSYFNRSSGQSTYSGSTYRMGSYTNYQITPLQFALLL